MLFVGLLPPKSSGTLPSKHCRPPRRQSSRSYNSAPIVCVSCPRRVALVLCMHMAESLLASPDESCSLKVLSVQDVLQELRDDVSAQAHCEIVGLSKCLAEGRQGSPASEGGEPCPT